MTISSPQRTIQASTCTGTYGGSTALPSVLAVKCDSTTCATLTSDLDVVKECLKGEVALPFAGEVHIEEFDFGQSKEP